MVFVIMPPLRCCAFVIVIVVVLVVVVVIIPQLFVFMFVIAYICFFDARGSVHVRLSVRAPLRVLGRRGHALARA
jgi:hypothetical protein